MQTGLHSNYSITHEPFEYPSLEEWREQGIKEGYSVLVFADHFDDFTENKFKAYKKRCEGLSDERMLLVPGIDYHYQKPYGHHLACNCYLGNRLPPVRELPKLCHEKGGISWVSHYGWQDNVPTVENIKFEDAVEIWWSFDEEPHYDIMAQLDIPFLASSEPKRVKELLKDQDKTLLFLESLTVESVLNAIKSGKVYMLGRKFT
jgi:hypothetical protein